MLALEEARKRNMLTVALLGNDGGEIQRQRLADFPVHRSAVIIFRVFRRLRLDLSRDARDAGDLNRGQA